ncbi:hypothetical protein [Desulfosarcina cetonica]|uniref:hypothetical protein n=1 Tax=Desulfosarcina cetonica TaxID=90730 RepID=UPI0006D1882E|nr:hypothetical protein [Desulfosarcina cetonica]
MVIQGTGLKSIMHFICHFSKYVHRLHDLSSIQKQYPMIAVAIDSFSSYRQPPSVRWSGGGIKAWIENKQKIGGGVTEF